jgi:hypothetical protein
LQQRRLPAVGEQDRKWADPARTGILGDAMSLTGTVRASAGPAQRPDPSARAMPASAAPARGVAARAAAQAEGTL